MAIDGKRLVGLAGKAIDNLFVKYDKRRLEIFVD